jgi:hypothetical protein
MSERPLIGDFRSKPGNQPRGSMISAETLGATVPPAPAPPTSNHSDQETLEVKPEPTLAEEVGKEEEVLSPGERYRNRLKQAGITLEEAASIYDAILDKGYYEEFIKIRKHRAVFRTRSYEEQLRVQAALETYQPRMALSQDELVSRYNLAASLYEWQGKALKHETDTDFENVLSLIKRLPQPVVGLLYDGLAKFDRKVMLVFSEGATDSF